MKAYCESRCRPSTLLEEVTELLKDVEEAEEDRRGRVLAQHVVQYRQHGRGGSSGDATTTSTGGGCGPQPQALKELEERAEALSRECGQSHRSS